MLTALSRTAGLRSTGRRRAGKNKKTGLFREFSIEIHDDTGLDGASNFGVVPHDE
jgi:hypothetical protein